MKTIKITADGKAEIKHERSYFENKQYLLIQGDEVVVSDGYHTIDELYEHRFNLYIALARLIDANEKTAPPLKKKVTTKKDGKNVETDMEYRNLSVWRSKIHSDGTEYLEWFILGIGKEKGKQITYHLPNARWGETEFAQTLEKAPEFDGHNSADVLERLKTL